MDSSIDIIRNATEMYFRLEEIGFVTMWKRSNFVRKKENENWQIVMTILLLCRLRKDDNQMYFTLNM